jgi:hypothetical protein
MFRDGIDTFALVINYLNETCTFKHVILILFELHETCGSAMALQLQSLLENPGLIHQVIVFVKYESNNSGTVVTTLQSIIDCESLNFLQVYEGTCFGHIMFKAYQYE